MQPDAVRIFFICVGAAAILYFIYYFVIPVFLSGYFLTHHYAKSKYENGIFWVKLKKEDKDYWVYMIDMTGVKVKDVCWQMYTKHKEAYEMYVKGRDDYGSKDN